jgi:hypothetical protein
MKCSKQLSVTMPWVEHRLLSNLDSNVRKFQLKIVSIQFTAPEVTQMQMWRKLAKSTKTDEIRNTISEITGRLGLI